MFKGAGILFVKKEGSQYFVSLGKRTVSPQKGSWSIPGGQMSSSDEEDYLACALRETREEYFSMAEKNFSSLFDKIQVKDCTILFIPFLIKYNTYLFDVTGININFSPNWEFSEIAWFSTRSLPEKTHLGVRYSLAMFNGFFK